MTLFTRQARMATCQWEIAQIMIEGGIIPIGWVVADRTIRAEAAVVLVILFMT